MSVLPQAGVRAERADLNRLAWAFALSLLLHALLFGTFKAGQKFGWWQQLHWPAWLKPPAGLLSFLKKHDKAPEPPQRELPLVFIDVSPEQATPEPPKDAKFYSNKNSTAANPDPKIDTETPRIDGKQTDVPKTEDVPREKFTPLQPTVATPTPPQPEERARPTEPQGDLTMARPDKPQPDPGEATHTRPKSVREALSRLGQTKPPGEKMRQEGGVRRELRISSVDAKATLFGDYDAALIDIIRERWYGLLDRNQYASDSRGKVVLQFRLHSDGRITDMTVAENTASEVLAYLCQRAVMDSAPFMVWTLDMRRMLGDSRNIQFTFFYN